MELRLVRSILAVLILLISQARKTNGHGRLIDPPSRGSMWRYGYNTPRNNDDTSLYCGGFSAQWELNGGRCGVCGDRYDRPREHEAGGKYAHGIIVRHYREGETISVKVDLTTSHLGYFEFRICPHNSPSTPVTQACLDRYLLQQPDGSTRYKITSYQRGVHNIRLVLPRGLTCTQCVLQWKYNAGNFWGCDGIGSQKKCCLGCGRQEQYYGCADVDVTSVFQTGVIQHPVGLTANGNHLPGNGIIQRPNVPVPVINPTPYIPPRQYQVNNFIPNKQQVNPNGNYIVASQAPILNQVFFPGQNHNAGQQQSASSLLYRCRGIMESMTEFCRRNCLAGYCSRIYCIEACQWLDPAYDQPKHEGTEGVKVN